jgi:hypothetical protein
MSFEAESNSELTVIVPAYQLHFQFPVQNKIHKQKILLNTGLAVLSVLVIFCPLGLTNFKKSVNDMAFLCMKLFNRQQPFE